MFCNRKRAKIKILKWDHNGFWLHYKRLEKDTFKWASDKGKALAVTERELRSILDGLTIMATAFYYVHLTTVL